MDKIEKYRYLWSKLKPGSIIERDGDVKVIERIIPCIDMGKYPGRSCIECKGRIIYVGYGGTHCHSLGFQFRFNIISFGDFIEEGEMDL